MAQKNKGSRSATNGYSRNYSAMLQVPRTSHRLGGFLGTDKYSALGLAIIPFSRPVLQCFSLRMPSSIENPIGSP